MLYTCLNSIMFQIWLAFIGRSSFLSPLPPIFNNGTAPLSSTQNSRSVSVHPLPSDDVKLPGEVKIACYFSLFHSMRWRSVCF